MKPKTDTSGTGRRTLKHRIITILAAGFLSIISLAGMAGGTTVTAHAATVLEICTVELTNTADGVELTWNAIEGAESYEIYRKTGDGDYRKIAVADSTETSWVDESVSSGTTYTYYVKPINETTTWDYEEAKIAWKSQRSITIINIVKYASLTLGLISLPIAFYWERKASSISVEFTKDFYVYMRYSKPAFIFTVISAECLVLFAFLWFVL